VSDGSTDARTILLPQVEHATKRGGTIACEAGSTHCSRVTDRAA
jgi:hypothetical protein